MAEFNPNDIGVANGNYFGLPYTAAESDIVILPVGWDVTTSYADGTSGGPEAIMDASLQVDLFDVDCPEAWRVRIGTEEAPEWIAVRNRECRAIAEEVISMLSSGNPDMAKVKALCAEVNRGSEQLNAYVYEKAKSLISEGKCVAVLGGDHSVPYGAIKAAAEKYGHIGILHVDAHADLRCAYEGFEYSHASIMYNSLGIEGVDSLTQVAVRDFCSDEHEIMTKDPRVFAFTDRIMSDHELEGGSWKDMCDRIVATLPDQVYISFDIDGLSPEYCPSTGTPVPGGLSFNKADYLLRKVATSGKRIVGFDLCEVSASENDEWDANVGARLLFKLCLHVNRNSGK